MSTPADVTVSMPQHPGASLGRVQAVWHAVDGVRVAVRFLAESAPLLAIGRAGELVFSRPEVETPVAALGKVAFRGDAGTERVYHFLFGERTRQSLAHLLEPRRTHRVHPEDDEPVEVTLLVPGDDERVVIAPARDVSGTGVGVDVPWEYETRLCQLDRVPIKVRLPGREDELEFEGVVRNRALGQGAICYGLEFARDAGEGDPRFEAIEAYVAACEAQGSGAARRSA